MYEEAPGFRPGPHAFRENTNIPPILPTQASDAAAAKAGPGVLTEVFGRGGNDQAGPYYY